MIDKSTDMFNPSFEIITWICSIFGVEKKGNYNYLLWTTTLVQGALFVFFVPVEKTCQLYMAAEDEEPWRLKFDEEWEKFGPYSLIKLLNGFQLVSSELE